MSIKALNEKKFLKGVALRFNWSQPIQAPDSGEPISLVRIHRTWNGDPSQDIILRSMWPSLPRGIEELEFQN